MKFWQTPVHPVFRCNAELEKIGTLCARADPRGSGDVHVEIMLRDATADGAMSVESARRLFAQMRRMATTKHASVQVLTEGLSFHMAVGEQQTVEFAVRLLGKDRLNTSVTVRFDMARELALAFADTLAHYLGEGEADQ